MKSNLINSRLIKIYINLLKQEAPGKNFFNLKLENVFISGSPNRPNYPHDPNYHIINLIFLLLTNNGRTQELQENNSFGVKNDSKFKVKVT